MVDLETQIEKLSAAIAGLELQQKSLGDAVVDPAIAALREQLNQLESARGDRAETDERKLVTIVFADVSGFTALSEKLDPEKVREVINACFDWLVPVVQKYDGTIDKFIGDEIMAVFGAPVAHEDDAERALRAALDMMDAIVAFNHANGTELGLHMGINTGLVVAGEIGGRGRRICPRRTPRRARITECAAEARCRADAGCGAKPRYAARHALSDDRARHEA